MLMHNERTVFAQFNVRLTPRAHLGRGPCAALRVSNGKRRSTWLRPVDAVRFGAVLAILLLCANTARAQTVQSPISEFTSGSVVRFSARGHVKAKGAVFSLKVPKSWAAFEGERPNIVQKFVSERGKGLEMVLVVTKSIPGNIPFGRDDIRDLLSSDGQTEMLPEGATLIAAKPSMIEAEPAGVMEYTMQTQRGAYHIYGHVLALTFFQGRTMVQVQFHVGGMPSDHVRIERQFSDFRPLFELMINSIVFEDKWQ